MLGRRAVLRVAVGALGLAGCSSTASTSTSDSPASTPTPSSSIPVRDFLEPGEATAVIKELVAAAGTINAIKVEISAHEASLSIVSGMTAKTWAWRKGTILVVDSDTQFVGQKIFDPATTTSPTSPACSRRQQPSPSRIPGSSYRSWSTPTARST